MKLSQKRSIPVHISKPGHISSYTDEQMSYDSSIYDEFDIGIVDIQPKLVVQNTQFVGNQQESMSNRPKQLVVMKSVQY